MKELEEQQHKYTHIWDSIKQLEDKVYWTQTVKKQITKKETEIKTSVKNHEIEKEELGEGVK